MAIKDKGYDSDAIRAYVNQLGANPILTVHINPPLTSISTENDTAPKISSPNSKNPTHYPSI